MQIRSKCISSFPEDEQPEHTKATKSKIIIRKSIIVYSIIGCIIIGFIFNNFKLNLSNQTHHKLDDLEYHLTTLYDSEDDCASQGANLCWRK